MATDPDLPDVIREALAAADSVDARAIDVVAGDDDDVVLRGTVSTFEESTAAAAIAGDHAPAVRNELRVDHNVREGIDPPVAEGDGDAASLQGSSRDPVAEPDDLVSDSQASLDENVPWDPPHEEVTVPTRAESRGVADRGPADDPDAGDILDEAADPAAKSLPDMTQQDLERAVETAQHEESSS
ncbi:MAG TPA: BON domain-containing protein [Egibacteraceae bacterium]|nr:BON domain-containing protein [Egibacteraceae bacterium]